MGMYTEEQAKKALIEKQMRDWDKRIALWNHEQACDWVHEIGLPYRICLDYLKNKLNHNVFEIEINRWYPMPKIPMAAELSKEERTPKREIELREKDLYAFFMLCMEPTGEINEQGQEVMTFRKDGCKDEQWQIEMEQIRQKAKDKMKPYLPWDLETEQGIKKWEYYFTRFILPYENDISTWNAFNMFGNKNHSIEELEGRKRYLLALIEDAKKNPSNYDLEPHYKQLSDYDTYNFENGNYMWVDNFQAEPPKHEQALEIMKREKQIEESYYIQSGREWELKCIDRYSKLYRINAIIEQLEKE